MVAAALLLTFVTALAASAAPAHRQPDDPGVPASISAGRTTPVVTLRPPTFAPLPTATPTPASTAAPAGITALSPELLALAQRGAPYSDFAALAKRQYQANVIDVYSIYMSAVRSRASSGANPTPNNPGQILRASALSASRASVTSSMHAGGTCGVTADCINSVPANANRYCDAGVCSYRCRSGFSDVGSSCVAPSSSTTRPATTSTKAAATTTTTTTTSVTPARQTCAVSSDCANSPPANANRYCDAGVCSYRCRSGYTNTGSACVETQAAPVTSTTTTSAPAATQTCALTSECENTPPANANRYCDAGLCSYRCRSGFTNTGLMCVETQAAPATSTTTTSAPAATQTCALTSECDNTAPANANRYCDAGLCSYRCRSGFTNTGSMCVETQAAPATSTTTTSAPAATQTCALTSECDNTPPANANRYCDAGVCSYRCRSGFTNTGSACVETQAAPVTSTTSAPAATQTCALTSECDNTPPANANRYCDAGVCSYRCRSGFTNTGSACVETQAAPVTSTTTTSAPAATQTCALTSECDNTPPANANRYCDAGVCSYRCRSGFTNTGSACVETQAAPVTSTTSAPAATQTCAATADCINTVPAGSNRYCADGVCGFRCRTGYAQSGSTCIAVAPSGASNASSWVQDPTFSTLADFRTDVINSGKFSWGDAQGNVAVMPDGVPASRWAGGVKGDSGPALQVTYPAGSRNPSYSPVGGMGFYTSKIDVSQATNVSFSYSVFFEDGFNFVKGGKLPGLYGGKSACSGGSSAENCFSARLMFRTGGMGELYLYAPREKQVDALCELGPLSYCNSVYGMSIGRGSWTFKTGEWTNIRQDIWLNTPGVADGGFNIWINDKLVLSSSQVYYRNSAVGLIGGGPASNTSSTVLIDYDALPADVVIPNGGFRPAVTNGTTAAGVFRPSFVTKIVGPTAAATTALPAYEDADGVPTATSLPFDWEARRNRLGRRLVALVPTPAPAARGAEKRAEKVATTVPGFLGAMCQTFFGGSSVDYNSPTLQHTYFRGFGMRVNR
ncbi:hypothetical protein JCM3770_007025 [Rhodotorula araucariae]